MFKQSIEKYFNRSRIVGTLSETTINSRKYELFSFAKFCERNLIDHPSKINEDIILDYLSYKKVFRKTTSLTRLTVLHTISAYMGFLVKKNIIPSNPAENIELPRAVYPDADYMDIDEVKKLFWFESELATKKTVDRNLLLLNMLFTLCLRGSEVVGLKMDDLKLELKQIWIKRKGGSIKKFPLNDEITDQIKDWLAVRKTYQGADSQWVFLSSHGNRLDERQARCIVANAMKRAGIKKRKKGTHILRHSGATFRLKNGGNIRIIKEILGHTSVATTEKYLHFKETELKQVIEESEKMLE
jgi:site-specific recombinase XerD